MKQFILILLVIISLSVVAQDEWIVPDTEQNKISTFIFNEDFAEEGSMIYENNCQSCHGMPGEENFIFLAPSPGDPAGKKFQSNTDGELYYKIEHGRGLMPSFDQSMSEDEIWSVIAYMRSYNETYIQPLPDLNGIVIPDYTLQIDFDDNIDKLVVKVLDDGEIAIDVEVKAYIKTMFGKYLLGKKSTNQYGIAYFDVDTKIPGDENGGINIIVKASKGYAFKKADLMMDIVTPTEPQSAIAGRHLWSERNKAPVWLIVMFLSVTVGIWTIILYILFGLRNIKKLNK